MGKGLCRSLLLFGLIYSFFYLTELTALTIESKTQTWKKQGLVRVYPVANGIVRLETGKNSSAYLDIKNQISSKLVKFDQLDFYVRNKNDSPATFEVQWVEPGGAARFWRNVSIGPGEFHEISLPLRWMRHRGIRLPSYHKVKYLTFYSREGFSLEIGGLKLRPGKGPAPTIISSSELLSFAFKGANGVVVECDNLRVFYQGDHTQAKKIYDHMLGLHQHMKTMFPPLNKNSKVKPGVIIFKEKKEYQDFVKRFAEKLNAVSNSPISGGAAFHTLATSYMNPEYGVRRPVFTHEFVHAWMEANLNIKSNTGSWLQEGIANWVQLQYYPQRNIKKIYRRGLNKINSKAALSELLSGKRIPIKNYWQTVTLIDWLNFELRGNWMPLIIEFQEKGMDGSESIVAKHLKIPVEKLSNSWVNHLKKMAK